MKKRVVSGLLTVCIVCAISGARAAAADCVVATNDTWMQNKNIQISENIIITKYRTYNGKRQYRNWDKTNHCWVEPHWIDV